MVLVSAWRELSALAAAAANRRAERLIRFPPPPPYPAAGPAVPIPLPPAYVP